MLKDFIGCGWLWYDHYGFDDVNVFMLARKEFNLAKIPAKADIKITADTRYKLYVNNHYVCFGPARGYPESYPFDNVDVAPYLNEGKNVLSVLVHQFGHGTFQSIYGGAAGLLVSGKIAGNDVGTKPKNWLIKKCPGHKQDMIRRTIQLGYQENFDARLVDPCWKEPDSDIKEGKEGWFYGGWRSVGCLPWLNLEERGIPLMKEEVRNFKKILKVCSGNAYPGWEDARNLTEVYLQEPQGIEASVQIRGKERMLEPGSGFAEIKPFPFGERLTLLMDFGEEVTGYIGISVEGKGGEVVDFTTAELLEKDRLCVLDPKIGCKVAPSDRFMLRAGKNNFETFAMHGFRYLSATLRNIQKPLKIFRIYVRQVSYPFEKTAFFASSDKTLNRIWDMCIRTQVNCSFDAYVDCPWREQAQWWGDARVQGSNTFHFFGDVKLLKRGIKQGGQSQISNGLTFGHFPTTAVGCVLPDFTLTWIQSQLDYYRYTGDGNLLKEQFPATERALGFFRRCIGKDGMLGIMPEWWVFLDWAPLYKDGYSAVFNMLYLGALKDMVQICRILGKKSETYQKEAVRLEEKIIRCFWSEKEQVFYDGFDNGKNKVVKKISQHTHALAILLDLKPDFHEKFVDRILLIPMKEPPLANKDIIEASPFFYFYVLNAVKKVGGREKEIIDFIKERWGQMLKDGSTTCYEMWNPTPGAVSLCHAWSAHPAVYFINILSGLKPLAPNWRKFMVNPDLLDIDRLNLRLPTVYGEIEVELKKQNGNTCLNIMVPKGTEGILETKRLKKTLAPGRHKISWR
ncbi:MAG: family 78 glycoside hydrolase catalytic domain [Candidatus Omnitrophica bacterium]|nr:family 78 glycoside hydrolase catalytic domain [Candidatus Omnitrophota bacterium]